MVAVEWDHLRTFLAVCRHGRVHAAARDLGVSRSTVNRRMDALEHAAGLRLLDRRPTGVVPTNAGRDLLPAAERMEEELLIAQRQLAGHEVALAGPIDITIFDAAVPLFVDLFAQLSDRWPEIELRVTASNEVLSLPRGESELAIRGTFAPSPNLFGSKVGSMSYGVFGVPDRVQEESPPWILWDETRAAVLTEKLAAERSSPLRVVARVNTFEMMLGLCRAGAGVALLPTMTGLREPGLQAWGEPSLPAMAQPIWILIHPDQKRARRVRTVMRYLLERVRPRLQPA